MWFVLTDEVTKQLSFLLLFTYTSRYICFHNAYTRMSASCILCQFGVLVVNIHRNDAHKWQEQYSAWQQGQQAIMPGLVVSFSNMHSRKASMLTTTLVTEPAVLASVWLKSNINYSLKLLSRRRIMWSICVPYRQSDTITPSYFPLPSGADGLPLSTHIQHFLTIPTRKCEENGGQRRCCW